MKYRDENNINEDNNNLKKIFMDREKVAIQKVNLWDDMRKGLKEKINRVNSIQSSNVQNTLISLMKDLEKQKIKLLDVDN